VRRRWSGSAPRDGPCIRQSCGRTGAPQTAAPPFVEFPEDGLDLPGYLATIERDLIHRALDRTHGNRNRAADLLHIKRTTLVEKLKRIGADN